MRADRSAEARTDVRFIRGVDTLTIDDRPAARGRRMTFAEATELFGSETVEAAMSDGITSIANTRSAVGNALRQRRIKLGLPVKTVAARSGVSVAEVEKAEASNLTAIRSYEHIARVLGLSDRALYTGSPTKSEALLGTRLRTLAQEHHGLGPSSTATLAEAAWVAATQHDLERQLAISANNFIDLRKPTSVSHPAFKQGYHLAQQVREDLALGEKPIESLRALAEDVLGVTVLIARLQPHIAGATITVGNRRAVVLNEVGENGRVAVRRATLAHELCHYLFDLPADLKAVRVDAFTQQHAIDAPDDIERRANAFAAELLVPQAAIHARQSVEQDPATWCNEFGVSTTLMRFQAYNASDRLGGLYDLKLEPPVDADWDGREAYTSAYSPIPGLMKDPLRAGRFSGVVVRAAECGYISHDSAAEWLRTTDAPSAVRKTADAFKILYSDIWDTHTPKAPSGPGAGLH